jgi:hypothetical protein
MARLLAARFLRRGGEESQTSSEMAAVDEHPDAWDPRRHYYEHGAPCVALEAGPDPRS